MQHPPEPARLFYSKVHLPRHDRNRTLSLPLAYHQRGNHGLRPTSDGLQPTNDEETLIQEHPLLSDQLLTGIVLLWTCSSNARSGNKGLVISTAINTVIMRNFDFKCTRRTWGYKCVFHASSNTSGCTSVREKNDGFSISSLLSLYRCVPICSLLWLWQRVLSLGGVQICFRGENFPRLDCLQAPFVLSQLSCSAQIAHSFRLVRKP